MTSKAKSEPLSEYDAVQRARAHMSIDAHLIGIQKALLQFSVEERRRLRKDLSLRLAEESSAHLRWTE